MDRFEINKVECDPKLHNGGARTTIDVCAHVELFMASLSFQTVN